MNTRGTWLYMNGIEAWNVKSYSFRTHKKFKMFTWIARTFVIVLWYSRSLSLINFWRFRVANVCARIWAWSRIQCHYDALCLLFFLLFSSFLFFPSFPLFRILFFFVHFQKHKMIRTLVDTRVDSSISLQIYFLMLITFLKPHIRVILKVFPTNWKKLHQQATFRWSLWGWLHIYAIGFRG